ncbi:MAG: carbon-nitrogen hydrolase family protein, partial [Sedimentisphaerales bacterium]|nr:carbon-nitrogen hydrolase family protein [Sedimentisphaerales bacterium]
YFTLGREFPVFEKKGLKFGIIICADGGYIEPARILALKGARFIFAPHFNDICDPIEHFQMVRNDHIARAVENSVYFLRGNNVIHKKDSVKNDKGLPQYGYGDSYVINPNGAIVAGAGIYNETLMIYNLDLNSRHRSWYKRSRNFKSAKALLEILQETIKNIK